MVWARAFYGSAEAYRRGEESLRQERVMEAITYFDRAIHWYTPLNPYVERSAQRLWNLGEDSERKGELTVALAALTSLKSGFVSADGLFTPGLEWIRRCEERIQALSKTKPFGSLEPGDPPPPSVFWTLVLEIGLLGWIGGVFWMIARFRKEKRLFPTLLKWGIPFLLSYGLWIIGMIKA